MDALSALAVMPPACILASAEPTWTDKEVLVAVGSVLGAMIPVVLFIVRFTTSWARAKAKKVERELANLQSKSALPPQQLVEMEKRLDLAQQELTRLQALNTETEDRAAKHRQLAEQLGGDLDSLRINLANYEDNLTVQRRRVERAVRKDGQIWTEKVLHNAPAFRALEPDGRRTPIISVLNLKGGVGKTTITANLAAALDGLGYRVLLLDIDLQGSLTGLYLSDARQAQFAGKERLLEDFLAASFGSEYPNLLDYTLPVLSEGRSGLVPTSDSLAYAELNLTIRWLLREGNRDPRFLLRRELQLRRITNLYDIILLDCPPLINVCCLNALAASDYVMVPIMPSQQATARVPVLLRRLKDVRENINPPLNILGVVVNRTHRSELTADETNRLSLLRVQCQDIWGSAVPQFETFIRQNVQLRVAEDEHRPLRSDEDMYQAFVDLAKEVQLRLPTFCIRTPQPRGSAREAIA
jgi:cellulose biosynthesis protein BcsQ